MDRDGARGHIRLVGDRADRRLPVATLRKQLERGDLDGLAGALLPSLAAIRLSRHE
jgi:hypothetical protein